MKEKLLWFVDARWGQRVTILLLGSTIAFGAYWRMVQLAGAVGFPVDDAWIYQTFARNLALRGEIAFNAGEPVMGASSVIWLLLLVIGYWLPIDPLGWTYGLTWLGYLGAGWLILELAPLWILDDQRGRWALVAAVFALLEWHLVWSAMAGMETTLILFLSLALLLGVARGWRAWVIGLVGGLLTAARLEGAVLFALVWLVGLRHRSWRQQILMLVVFGLVLAPILAINWIVGGSVLPNTMGARLVGVEQPAAGLAYLFEFTMMLALGLNVLLLPALLFLLQAPTNQKRPFYLPLAWVGALLMTYVITFPVIYHHMRYMMPTLPFLVMLGVAGTAYQFRRNRAVGWVQLGLSGVFAVALALFGMNVFAWNVQNVNAQHIRVANWLATNTPTAAQVAADDIGAIGYFSGRYVVDLYGLVTPEILPYLRGRQSLAPFVCNKGVEYLAVFPHTHPEFAALPLDELFRAHLDFNTSTPNADMLIYRVANCAK